MELGQVITISECRSALKTLHGCDFYTDFKARCLGSFSVAITEYHKPSNLLKNIRDLCSSQFWRLGNPRAWCQHLLGIW